ncbi:MAG: glycosyltransferase family 2 protein [Vicingaceae bacterium]|nr:glycosyltransferase [Flavobacteriales bacterium]MDF1676004.1 glycosyltransferase family 2 protein [Vicingaceae bacterium]
MLKKVSILIPLYNAEQYIAETIDSIFKQTYENIEIIIVDDGSTDNSYEIAKTYASEKVKVFQQENKGGCAARNKALELSTGEYIVFFDADDIMYKDKIKNQIELVEKYGDDYIYSSQWISFTGNTPTVFPHKTVIDKDFDSPIDWLSTSWLNKSGAVGIWLTPKKLIEQAGKWNETLKVNQDGEYFFRVLLKSKGVKFTDNAYLFYRREITTSISNKHIPERAESILKSYISYEKILELKDTTEVRKALAFNYTKFIYIYHKKEKELINIAWQRIENLNVDEKWKIGGKKFQLLCQLIGFRNALKLKK